MSRGAAFRRFIRQSLGRPIVARGRLASFQVGLLCCSAFAKPAAAGVFLVSRGGLRLLRQALAILDGALIERVKIELQALSVTFAMRRFILKFGNFRRFLPGLHWIGGIFRWRAVKLRGGARCCG